MAFEAHGPRVGLKQRLAAALGIAGAVAVLEGFGSWWSGSLALLSDAGHVATDAVAVGLSLAALRISERPHTPRMSFGYHRIEVLAAFVNAVLLAAIASFLVLQAVGRAMHPQEIQGTAMLGIGAAGLAGNLLMVGLLRRWARRNLNIRGAFLHAYSDALGSAGVVTGAIVIALTGIVFFDVLIALFIVGLIVLSAARLLRDSVRIILEASPVEVPPADVAEAIRSVPGVRSVHDLHVWTATSGLYLLTGHLAVAGGTTVREAGAIVDAVQARLRDRFGIAHATLQVDSLEEELISAADVAGPGRE